MGSAVDILMELYEALSFSERADVIEKILKGSAVKSASAWSVPGSLGSPYFGASTPVKDLLAPMSGPEVVARRKGWKKPPYWTKTVDSVDHMSVNASGAEGKWGFEAGQTKPVLFGFSKPRHLYAVLKATPGGEATITDDDGFEVTVPNAEVVMTSKDWVAVRERLTDMLNEF